MRANLGILIPAIIIALAFAGCKEDKKTTEEQQNVESEDSTSVTTGIERLSAVSVVLRGKANLGNSVASDLQVGFQYSTSAGILPSNSTTIEANDADAKYNYSASVTGLEPSTTYYFRSFVRQSGQDTYGETKEFTTKDITSILETTDATSVEATSATLNAKLDLTDVQFDNISYGFLWGISESDSSYDHKCSEVKDDSISAVLSGLSHKTQYWYKAYVKLDSQTFNGEVKTFTTDVIPVESVSLDKITYTFYSIGDTLTLLATVSPSDATDKRLEWSSDNESVATVDNSGRVTAKDNGNAIITVKSVDQERTDTCDITVTQLVTSITISEVSLSLVVGEEASLSVTFLPDNANDKTCTWISSDNIVATVDENGKVTAVTPGTAIITATANDGNGITASCSVVVYPVCPDGAVDLGLSVFWATCNLSKSGFVKTPEQYGDYYAWGEIVPKESYSWSTYKWCKGDKSRLTKYNTTSSDGTVDNKTTLDPEDDVAHVKLGGSWRMPTDAEWTELWAKCTGTWTNNYNGTGVAGCILTSKIEGYKDKSIFLPFAGFRGGTGLDYTGSRGYYWSSSLYTDGPVKARSFYFPTDYGYRNTVDRYRGESVRPVHP